jgi:hypothetical protein
MSAQQQAALEQERSYELTRKYEIYHHEAEKPSTQVLAKIQYEPPRNKSYQIQQSSGGMGERTIRHVLDHEVDLTRNPERVAMVDQNYDFSFAGEDTLNGHHCYVLDALPKRDDRDLLRAKVWVDGKTYRVMRVQGRPEKNPSFWVKELHVTLDYSEIGGMWMHTSTEAEASLRIGGSFTFKARDLEIRPTEDQQAARRGPKAAAVMAGAVVH